MLGCVLYGVDSKIRVLLLAAGDGARWQNYMDMPKFMVPIDGVPLVENTIARLRELVVGPIQLLVKQGDKSAISNDVVEIDPNPTNSDADKFVSSRALWNAEGQTVLAFADVYYSDCALYELLVCVPNTIRFLGRNRESSFTGCDHSEIFAISFASEHHDELDRVLKTFGSDQTRPSDGSFIASFWQLPLCRASQMSALCILMILQKISICRATMRIGWRDGGIKRMHLSLKGGLRNIAT